MNDRFWLLIFTAPFVTCFFGFIILMVYEGTRSYEAAETEKDATRKRNGALSIALLFVAVLTEVAIIVLSR